MLIGMSHTSFLFVWLVSSWLSMFVSSVHHDLQRQVLCSAISYEADFVQEENKVFISQQWMSFLV